MIELSGESSTTELETEAATETTFNPFLPPVKTLWDGVVNPLATQSQSGNPYIEETNYSA